MLYERNECVSVDLVEMWPPSTSIVTCGKVIVVVEVIEVKLMLLSYALMLLIKLCKRSSP